MDENDRISFWKSNNKAVPGSPNPKNILFPITNTSKTFQDFQASVSDAWKLDDDELGVLQSAKISKRVSESAAVNVLNTHRKSLLEKSESKPIPGRPQIQKSNINHFSEDYESKLNRFESALSSISLTITELCQLSWSGVPVKMRPITWKLLSGYLPINQERRHDVLERKRQDYWCLVKKYYETDERDVTYKDTYHQIHIDVPRMNPSVSLFQQLTVQKMFERILFIWAIRHPASGYVQGMNDLVTPFYIVFLQEVMTDNQSMELCYIDQFPQEVRNTIEADSFWCLSKFLDGIQDNYVFAQPGIQSKVLKLQKLIHRVDNVLHSHLIHNNIDYLQFSFRWLNNLLTRELPLQCTIRLWDTYLAENDSFDSFQLYVCAAFLLHWRDQLLVQKDFPGLMLLLQNLPTRHWTSSHIGLLVAEAYKLKVMFADAPNHLRNNQGNG